MKKVYSIFGALFILVVLFTSLPFNMIVYAKSNSAYVTDGRDFSENVAWVKKDGKWICIDTKGKKLFSLKSGDTITTDFHNGVSVINNKTLINKSGKRITDKMDYDRILSPSNTAESGYYFVEKDYDTLELTEKKVGVIDSKGKWILNLTSEKDLKYGFPRKYFGDGYFVMGDREYYTDVDIIFNIFDKTSIELKHLIDFDAKYMIYIKDKGFMSYDGYGGTFRSGYFTDFSGNTSKLFSNSTYVGLLSNGSFLIGEKDNGRIVDYINDKTYDLPKYNQIELMNTYKSYGMIKITNSGGGTFFTIIDSKGNFLFDPISIGKWSECVVSENICTITDKDGNVELVDFNGKIILKGIPAIYKTKEGNHKRFFSDGMIAIREKDTSDITSFSYYNKTGKKVIASIKSTNTVAYIQAYDFSNGFARIEENGRRYYIDKKGKLLIIK